MEQSQPQLYNYLYYVLLHQNTDLQVKHAFGTLQRDKKLEQPIKEELFQKPVVKNELNSDDCNTYSERSSYNKREADLLLKSIKEVELESVITENIDLKNEIISGTPGDSTTFLENKPADYVLPIQNTDFYPEDVLKALKPNLKLELPKSIKEEIEMFPATAIWNASSTSNNYYNHDTCTENSSQNKKQDELVLHSIDDDIKLDPIITEKINLKDEIISETLSESIISLEDKLVNHVSLTQDVGFQIKEEIKLESPTTEEILPESVMVVNEENSASKNDYYNACIERSFQYSEDNMTIESIKAATNKTVNNASKSNMVKPKSNPGQTKVRYCRKCAFQTLSRSTLRNHKIAKHTEKFYACPQCPFKTKWKDYLQDHIGTHAGDEGKHLKCNLCDFKTALRTNLKKHKLSVHVTERRFECELCPYKAKLKDGLKRHMDRTHNKGDYFKCDVCDYKTEFKHTLIEHAKSHTGEKFLKCSECEYRGKTKRSMKIHMVKHSTQRSFECYECGHKTKVKSVLIIHVQKHRTDKRHKCTDCGYSTNLKYSLNQHLKKYGHASDSKKMFSCDICDYVTSSDKILKWHVKVHTGEKLFECHLCEYKTSSSSNFRKHEYIHEKRNKS